MTLLRSFLAALGLLFAAAQAFAGIHVANNLTEEMSVSPGDHLSKSLIVHNDDQEPVEVKIGQYDYRTLADGSVLFDPPGTQVRSNANWIHLDTTRVRLDKNMEWQIPYTITVPNDPSLKGTYWSTLMVEPAPAAFRTPEKGVGLQFVVRYAIKIATTIRGTGEVKLQISKPVIQVLDKDRRVVMGVANSGTRLFMPTAVLQVYAKDGRVLLESRRPAQALFPGCGLYYTFDVNTLDPGKYASLVLLESEGDTDNVFGAQVELDIPTLGSAPVTQPSLPNAPPTAAPNTTPAAPPTTPAIEPTVPAANPATS